MISFHKIEFGEECNWYLLVGNHRFPRSIVLSKPPAVSRLDEFGRSKFYFHKPTKSLVKLKIDKYSPRSNFIRWLGRVVIQERGFLQLDSRKESIGNHIIRRAGLRTVESQWGVALNPFNRRGSVYFMDFCSDAERGKDYFCSLDSTAKRNFLQQLCDGISAIATLGYYNRDLHLGNVLVRKSGELIWIDTHLSRLPLRTSRRKRELIRSVVRKIPDKDLHENMKKLLLYGREEEK